VEERVLTLTIARRLRNTMKVLFRKFEAKKWSTRYNECNEHGEDISDDFRNTLVGAIYVKHSTDIGKADPEFIEVEIKVAKDPTT
jgi:hypothetical protein